jgi:hypothetical protein
MTSTEKEEIIFVCMLNEEEQKKKGDERRRFWARNTCKKRFIQGEFHSLYPDLLKILFSIFG